MARSLAWGSDMKLRDNPTAFTLIEILVSIAVIALLVGILVPYLSKARAQAKRAVCQSRLRVLGQGMSMYAHENRDFMMPGRMPKVDNERWSVGIEGGIKYRPTFLAMMGSEVGVAPFDDPQKKKGPGGKRKDRFGELADRQNYSSNTYLCPVVPEWTDERNGAFGYNYQFLGNARLYDREQITSFKNWPVFYSRVKSPAGCIAVGDAMGTAASFAPRERRDYENNGVANEAFGNEGFNLDPPLVDPENGEMAGFGGENREEVRTALHQRHLDKANVLWVDGHVTVESNASVGYEFDETGAVTFGTLGETSNRLWSLDRSDGPWLQKKKK